MLAGVGLLGGCVPAPAGAPSSARVYRVGVLRRELEDEATWNALALRYLRERLAELGYVEGQNLAFEERRVTEFADQSQDRLYAAELAQLPLDVIVALMPPAARAAAVATESIPIVMVGGPGTFVEDGLAESFARPGRNVTGVVGPGIELEQKRLQQLVEAVPGISMVAVLGVAPPPPLESAARSLGVELIAIRGTTPEAYEAGLQTAVAGGANALLVRSGQGTNPNSGFIGGLSVRFHLPGAFPNRTYVVGGGLMSYESRASEIARRAAEYVDRILRGTRPGDLPIELPTRYDLVVNMGTARALGLSFSRDFMAQVDEVIE